MPWMGPPGGWAGGWVPWHLVVMRNPDVHAVLTEVYAFPTGVLFTLAVRVRPSALPQRSGPFDPPPMMSIGTSDGPLFGMAFADGRKAAFHRPVPPPDVGPDWPVLTMCGGAGGGGVDEMAVWLWPLPPEGPLTIVAAWPALGVSETEATLDAADLISAATRAEALWPEEPEPGGWGSYARSVEVRPDPDAAGPELHRPDA